MTIQNLYIERANNGFIVTERDPMRGPCQQPAFVARTVDELCDVLCQIENGKLENPRE